jgi:hypothetical protein
MITTKMLKSQQGDHWTDIYYADGKSLYCAAEAGFFTVQQRLTIPGLLHSVRTQEYTKRNNLHQEKHPELMYLMRTRQNKNKPLHGEGGQDGDSSQGDENPQDEFQPA